MQSARGCIQLEKIAKDAEGARRGITRWSSTKGSMLGEARMQLLKPKEQACMQDTSTSSLPTLMAQLEVLQACSPILVPPPPSLPGW